MKREAVATQSSNSSVTWFAGMAPIMRELDREMTCVASSRHSVLITGESGTGKTTAAKDIHDRSGRRAGPFVDLNCAALPDNLVESELFGYERGAFTSAIGWKKGLFEVANEGTLFLDEIGELKLDLQAKLLKAIDDRKIRRVGGVKKIKCDVRLMAASSRNLQRMIAAGRFREDLYYRLTVFELRMPPLRERREDICEFVRRQLALDHAESGRPQLLQIDESALTELCRYTWPGNIRQLQNVVARLASYAAGDVISAADVRAQLARFEYLDSETLALPDSCSVLLADESLDKFSRRVRGAAIEATKRRSKGNMSEVARRLKVDRSSLYEILHRINGGSQSRVRNNCAADRRGQLIPLHTSLRDLSEK